MSTSNYLRPVFAIAVLVTVLCQAAPLSLACGPFTLVAVFTFTRHPDYPLDNFAQGEIGIVQPSFARSYLYVAYRHLSGAGFTKPEQEEVTGLWHDRLNLRFEPSGDQAVKGWLEARQKVVIGPAPKINVYRSRENPDHYETYLNCQGDAFDTATTTLEARTKQFGPESAAVKQWVEAQDQVFANCSEGQHIPAALEAGTDDLLRADRDYQIAAANFYIGNYELAKTQFEAIAVQTKSPWRATAPYLVARALLRKASLGSEDTEKANLASAEEEFNRVLTNPDLKSSHVAARRLLNIVRLRLHPEDRLRELGESLAGKSDQPSLKQDLWDYTILLDRISGDAEANHRQALAAPADPQRDDLTDWIITFQSDKPEAVEHALERWQATSSTPWLIAALSKVEPQHAKATSLQEAAARIPLSSPAFATASFQRVRLDIVAGRSAEARTKLDDLLGKYRSRFNRSSLNLLQQQRLMVSSSLEEFVAYAPRIPAGFSWDEDGRELPADEAEVGEELKLMMGKPLFDSDAAALLDRRMPLTLLAQIATNHRLPAHLRRDVVQAAWLRAVLLGNHTTATALVPTLRAEVPELAALLNEYVRDPEPAAKKFSAIYAWLKFPGMEPAVDTGVGRDRLDEQDSYRDNWWCAAAFSLPESQSTKEKKEVPGEIPAERRLPSFLTRAQLAAADKESATLATFGPAPNFLCRQVLEWAAKHPSDSRVPEALHLAVKTTRHGCIDKQTGKWSKAAHDFLHRRYPNSSWAKKTPFWFKE